MWQRLKRPAAILLLSAAAVWLSYKAAKNYNWLKAEAAHFWATLLHVRLSFVILAVLLIFTSYACRSWRWRAFVAPIKPAGLMNIFVSTLVGFSAVALFGRPGELVRPLLIARKENLSIASQFGAWTLERVFDGLTVGTILGMALFLMPAGAMMGRRSAAVVPYLRRGGIVLFAGAIAFGVVLSQLRKYQQIVLKVLSACARPLPERQRMKAQGLIGRAFESFADGLSSVGSGTALAHCTVWSFLVWIPVLLAFWAVAQSFGQPMSSMGIGSVGLLMALTVTGSLVQIPGIGGGFQVVTVLALTQLFRIPLEIATSAAMLLWLVGFLMVLIPGVPLAAREGLSIKRLRVLINSGAVSANRKDAPPIAVNPDSTT